MDNVHIFLHIKAVRAAVAVYFVATMVGAKAIENAVVFPLTVDFFNKLGIKIDVHFKSFERKLGFGAVLVHYGIVVPSVNFTALSASPSYISA